MTDLSAAIELYQEALERTSSDQPTRVIRLRTYGAALYSRYLMTGKADDMQMAIESFRTGLNQSSAPIQDRLSAGRFLLGILAETHDWERGYEATTTSLENSDKQHWLSGIAGLASDAAAVALNAHKDPFDAVQLLELGRGIISGSLNDIRADVEELVSSHPNLRERYLALRQQLDTPTQLNPIQQEPARQDPSQGIVSSMNEHMSIRGRIHSCPGFEDFLLAPSEPSMLKWLWSSLASPVLDTLGFTQSPTNDDRTRTWPHIWWIPTGALTKFPLHAAGLYRKGGHDTVVDRAMSSYSASVKAIIHGRRQRIASSTPAQALLVALKDTPGASTPLPFAVKEIKELRQLCESMRIQPIEPGRRKQDIVQHLPNCKIFHFAGHGHTNQTDPSRSYMHLISACQLAEFRHLIGTLWEVNDETCVDMAKFTYRGMKDDGGVTDDSVFRGLHQAALRLRDRWLETMDEIDSQRDGRAPRDIILDEGDDEEGGSMYWVPYVHFGV
ncbi:hypothetical protein EDB81DRAFT_906012 [Dactylonectria macrodidyma]|uniref:CHAT domain-containing protein n=1 Tax=Dactylonectria macrodidyma TaxID=307937 RepID=A0A9P9IU33_9HYPO|nr:hypothetical protein EDB81DRAFT_906012 [Dactylonectria macrodidyma]